LFGVFTAVIGLSAGYDKGGRIFSLAYLLVPTMGAVLSFLALLAVASAVWVIWFWRGEQDRQYQLPGAKELDLPHVERWKPTSVLGQLLPVAVPVIFLATWTIVLIKMWLS
jgi:hypothetical protein